MQGNKNESDAECNERDNDIFEYPISFSIPE